MGWISKRKKDLKKLWVGVNRMKAPAEKKEQIRREIRKHRVKVDAILEMKRQSLERRKGRARPGYKRTYSYCKKKVKANPAYAEAVKIILGSEDLTLAKLEAMKYLVSKGVPENQAYDFADKVTHLEKADYAELLITPKKKVIRNA